MVDVGSSSRSCIREKLGTIIGVHDDLDVLAEFCEVMLKSNKTQSEIANELSAFLEDSVVSNFANWLLQEKKGRISPKDDDKNSSQESKSPVAHTRRSSAETQRSSKSSAKSLKKKESKDRDRSSSENKKRSPISRSPAALRSPVHNTSGMKAEEQRSKRSASPPDPEPRRRSDGRSSAAHAADGEKNETASRGSGGTRKVFMTPNNRSKSPPVTGGFYDPRTRGDDELPDGRSAVRTSPNYGDSTPPGRLHSRNAHLEPRSRGHSDSHPLDARLTTQTKSAVLLEPNNGTRPPPSVVILEPNPRQHDKPPTGWNVSKDDRRSPPRGPVMLRSNERRGPPPTEWKKLEMDERDAMQRGETRTESKNEGGPSRKFVLREREERDPPSSLRRRETQPMKTIIVMGRDSDKHHRERSKEKRKEDRRGLVSNSLRERRPSKKRSKKQVDASDSSDNDSLSRHKRSENSGTGRRRGSSPRGSKKRGNQNQEDRTSSTSKIKRRKSKSSSSKKRTHRDHDHDRDRSRSSGSRARKNNENENEEVRVKLIAKKPLTLTPNCNRGDAPSDGDNDNKDDSRGENKDNVDGNPLSPNHSNSSKKRKSSFPTSPDGETKRKSLLILKQAPRKGKARLQGNANSTIKHKDNPDEGPEKKVHLTEKRKNRGRDERGLGRRRDKVSDLGALNMFNRSINGVRKNETKKTEIEQPGRRTKPRGGEDRFAPFNRKVSSHGQKKRTLRSSLDSPKRSSSRESRHSSIKSSLIGGSASRRRTNKRLRLRTRQSRSKRRRRTKSGPGSISPSVHSGLSQSPSGEETKETMSLAYTPDEEEPPLDDEEEGSAEERTGSDDAYSEENEDEDDLDAFEEEDGELDDDHLGTSASEADGDVLLSEDEEATDADEGSDAEATEYEDIEGSDDEEDESVETPKKAGKKNNPDSDKRYAKLKKIEEARAKEREKKEARKKRRDSRRTSAREIIDLESEELKKKIAAIKEVEMRMDAMEKRQGTTGTANQAQAQQLLRQNIAPSGNMTLNNQPSKQSRPSLSYASKNVRTTARSFHVVKWKVAVDGLIITSTMTLSQDVAVKKLTRGEIIEQTAEQAEIEGIIYIPVAHPSSSKYPAPIGFVTLDTSVIGGGLCLEPGPSAPGGSFSKGGGKSKGAASSTYSYPGQYWGGKGGGKGGKSSWGGAPGKGSSWGVWGNKMWTPQGGTW